MPCPRYSGSTCIHSRIPSPISLSKSALPPPTMFPRIFFPYQKPQLRAKNRCIPISFNLFDSNFQISITRIYKLNKTIYVSLPEYNFKSVLLKLPYDFQRMIQTKIRFVTIPAEFRSRKFSVVKYLHIIGYNKLLTFPIR